MGSCLRFIHQRSRGKRTLHLAYEHDIGTRTGCHTFVHEVHALLHPTENGMTLSFAVNGLRASSRTMQFTVEQRSGHTAQIHCLNCGDDVPAVEITRLD